VIVEKGSDLKRDRYKCGGAEMHHEEALLVARGPKRADCRIKRGRATIFLKKEGDESGETRAQK